jgi:hypothetical protein
MEKESEEQKNESFFGCPRISSASDFLRAQKCHLRSERAAKAAGTKFPQTYKVCTSFIHPGCPIKCKV